MAQATLNGYLTDDGGKACTVWFEWGTSTRYGLETPKQAGFRSGDSFSAVVFNLAEGVLYHYRAVAMNSTTIVYGNDQIFAIPVGSRIAVMLDDAGLYQFLEVN